MVLTLIVGGIILFAIDFGLKKWLKNYKKIFLTQLALALLVIVFYGYKFNRTKTKTMDPVFLK